MALFYASIIVTIISTAICYFVAKQRKANAVFWLVMGAALGPFAIPFVFFAKPKLQV